MGLFDEIRFKRPMPDGYTTPVFQTKDMACEMAIYEVGDDDRLMKLTTGWADDDPLNLPQDCDFHGWLNFYHYDKAGKWHEYDAKFTDGRLMEIKPANAKVSRAQTTPEEADHGATSARPLGSTAP